MSKSSLIKIISFARLDLSKLTNCRLPDCARCPDCPNGIRHMIYKVVKSCHPFSIKLAFCHSAQVRLSSELNGISPYGQKITEHAKRERNHSDDNAWNYLRRRNFQNKGTKPLQCYLDIDKSVDYEPSFGMKLTANLALNIDEPSTWLFQCSTPLSERSRPNDERYGVDYARPKSMVNWTK